MAIDLTKPLTWKSTTHEEQMMLRSLQGNILKGHGRVETTNIFFTIDAGKALAMRRALRTIANFHVTSAQQQLVETEAFQRSGHAGSTFVAAFLANDPVVSVAAGEKVGSGAAQQPIVAIATSNRIDACTPIHLIVARAAIDGIGAVESFDQVRTAFPENEVERVPADQVVGLVGSVDERHASLLRLSRPMRRGRTQCSTTTFGRGRRSVYLPALVRAPPASGDPASSIA